MTKISCILRAKKKVVLHTRVCKGSTSVHTPDSYKISLYLLNLEPKIWLSGFFPLPSQSELVLLEKIEFPTCHENQNLLEFLKFSIVIKEMRRKDNLEFPEGPCCVYVCIH